MSDTSANGKDLAALLIVAMESGLLVGPSVSAAIDRHIAARESPEAWLINASLAKTPDDVLAILREAAGDHQCLSDLAVWADAAEMALARGIAPESVSQRLLHVPWPDSLKNLMYHLDEGVFCAPYHGGPPAGHFLRDVLDDLAERCGLSSWHDHLEELVELS